MRLSRSDADAVRLDEDHWPETVEVSGELLEGADGVRLSTNGEFIRFTVVNGWALYGVTGERPGTGLVEPVHRTIEARLLECELR